MIEIIGQIVAVIGLIILIWSIFILQRQTREIAKQTKIATEATKTSIYSNISAQMIEIDRFFFDHPEIKCYFYKGKEISEEDPDYDRISSIAEMLVDFMDQVMVLRNQMPEFPWDETWVRYFSEISNSSPALQKYWKKHRDWYSAQIKGYYPDGITNSLERGI